MKKLFITVAFIAFPAMAGTAFAQGVPTVDTKNILESLKQFDLMLEDIGLQTEQLDQLKTQVTTLDNQLKQLEDLYANFEGIRDVVGLAMEGDIEGFLDGSMTDVMGTITKGMRGDWSGLLASKSPNMRKTMEEALANAGFNQRGVTDLATSGKPGGSRIASTATGGAVLAAAADQTHTEMGNSMERVEEITRLMGESQDMKMSIDLNTRMLAEVVITLGKSLELQSIEAAYAGQMGVNEAAIQAEERAFLTFSAE